MVNYSCEKCGKEFSQKVQYKKHLNKKKPCVVETKVKEMLDDNTIDFQNIDGINYLNNLENNSIDLILTDPPYIISRESGMNTHYNKVKDNENNNIEAVKTEKEWEEYKTINNIDNDINKSNYLKYGTIYGKKYCVKTDYVIGIMILQWKF